MLLSIGECYCSPITRRVIPEALSKYAERTADTFWPVSYHGGSDARKPTYRASARGFPNLYRGFWKTSLDLLHDKRDYDRRTNDRRKLGKIQCANKRFAILLRAISRNQVGHFRFFSQMRTCLLSFAFIYLCLHCRSRNNIICGVTAYSKKYTHKKWNIESYVLATYAKQSYIVAVYTENLYLYINLRVRK